MQSLTATTKHGVTRKRAKILKHTGNLFRKTLQEHSIGKHSIGREFHSLAIRGKKLLTYTSLKHLGMVTENNAVYQDNE